MDNVKKPVFANNQQRLAEIEKILSSEAKDAGSRIKSIFLGIGKTLSSLKEKSELLHAVNQVISRDAAKKEAWENALKNVPTFRPYLKEIESYQTQETQAALVQSRKSASKTKAPKAKPTEAQVSQKEEPQSPEHSTQGALQILAQQAAAAVKELETKTTPFSPKRIESKTKAEEDKYKKDRNAEWLEMPGDEKLAAIQEARRILQNAPRLPDKIKKAPDNTPEALLNRVRTATAKYNEAENSGNDDSIAPASQDLFSTLEVADSNKEALDLIFVNQELINNLKSVVQYEIKNSPALKDKCPNLLRRFTKLDIKQPEPELTEQQPETASVLRPSTASALLQSSATAPTITAPDRPQTAPADVRRDARRGGIFARFWQGVKNVFGSKNRVSPVGDEIPAATTTTSPTNALVADKTTPNSSVQPVVEAASNNRLMGAEQFNAQTAGARGNRG